MADESARLDAERDELKKLADKQKINLDLGLLQKATALGKRQEQLAKYLDDLDKLIKDANSDERREQLAMVKRAEVLEKQADFDKAIEQFEASLKIRDDGGVKAHLNQLKIAWAIKNKEHAQARQFIYVTWPSLDLTAVTANIARAAESFRTCKEAGDYLTPHKLFLVNIQHAKELTTQLEVLRKAPDGLDNRARLKSLLQLTDQLRALQSEVDAWVAKDKTSAK